MLADTAEHQHQSPRAVATGEWRAVPHRRRPRAARTRPCPPVTREESTALATIAHEIRGPITALVTSSDLLAADFDTLPVDEARAMVSGIHRRAIYLSGLVENLLCAATARDGTLVLRRRAVDLADLLADARAVVEPLIAQRRQHVRFRVAANVPNLSGDDRRLGQVLVNLLLNASKFSDVGTRIDVTVTRRGETVRVAVADRGPGLPPGDAERLFQPYYRAPGAETVSKEGVGLGLSIVKLIVEAHAGHVGAEDRPGGGARFWFELPLAAA
jgi:two-component system, OmpR family, sensor histidine kinase KdpD